MYNVFKEIFENNMRIFAEWFERSLAEGAKIFNGTHLSDYVFKNEKVIKTGSTQEKKHEHAVKDKAAHNLKNRKILD